jgi:hypothetical protein
MDNELNDCLMTIDGTDFRIQQKGVTKKGNAFGSHKYAGKSALHYELGIDILKGNLVRVEGPYPAGAWPDIKIFLNCLVGHLLPGKRVEVRRYDQMEGVSERLGVLSESRSGSVLCEKGVSNGGTLRESSE